MHAARVLGLLLAWAALAAVPATAHPESAAPTLRSDVLAAWHDPPVVEPHTQWHGYLQMTPDSNVTAASFQICRVGLACFAPPTPAQDLGNGTWGFDTNDYTVNGRPVDYESGWRLGVKWWLSERSGNGTSLVEFPDGPDPSAPECDGDGALACAEAHYLAFDVERSPKGSPALPALGMALALAALAFVRRP